MKCLSTFICCGWAHGWSLKLLCLWRYWLRKLFLLKWGKEVEPNDILWCHGWGWESLLTASHINVRNMYTKCLAPWYVVGGHMGEPWDCYTLCQGGGPNSNFATLRWDGAPMTVWCHGWGCKPSLSASHIHIGGIWSVWAHSYTLDGDMGAPLHCNTCAGGVRLSEMML